MLPGQARGQLRLAADQVDRDEHLAPVDREAVRGRQGQIPGAGHGPAGGGVAPGPPPGSHIAGHDPGPADRRQPRRRPAAEPGVVDALCGLVGNDAPTWPPLCSGNWLHAATLGERGDSTV